MFRDIQIVIITNIVVVSGVGTCIKRVDYLLFLQHLNLGCGFGASKSDLTAADFTSYRVICSLRCVMDVRYEFFFFFFFFFLLLLLFLASLSYCGV